MIRFGVVFFGREQRKPLILGDAARFARVEGEVRKNTKPKIFGGRIFWRGMQMQNVNAGIHKYIVECLPQPTHARTIVHPLAVLRKIINGGDGSPKCGMIFEICSIFSTRVRVPMLKTGK